MYQMRPQSHSKAKIQSMPHGRASSSRPCLPCSARPAIATATLSVSHHSALSCPTPQANLITVTDGTSICKTPDFQSRAPVLPNGSYAVPLDKVQDTDSHCHLNLNETNGPLMGTGNSSNSGNFIVNVQCVFLPSTFPPCVIDLERARHETILTSIC